MKIPILRLLGIAATVAAITLSTSGATGATDAAGADVDAKDSGAQYEQQARAAGLSDAQAIRLQDRVDGYLKRMEIDAHQVSLNEIVADDGSGKLTLALPGAGKARAHSTDSSRQPDCRPGWLCMWAGDHYDHDRVDLYECGKHKLRYWNFENRLTSFINNQSYQTRAIFWIWTGSKWDELIQSVAPQTIPDLGDWQTLNNRIDMVEPC